MLSVFYLFPSEETSDPTYLTRVMYKSPNGQCFAIAQSSPPLQIQQIQHLFELLKQHDNEWIDAFPEQWDQWMKTIAEHSVRTLDLLLLNLCDEPGQECASWEAIVVGEIDLLQVLSNGYVLFRSQAIANTLHNNPTRTNPVYFRAECGADFLFLSERNLLSRITQTIQKSNFKPSSQQELLSFVQSLNLTVHQLASFPSSSLSNRLPLPTNPKLDSEEIADFPSSSTNHKQIAAKRPGHWLILGISAVFFVALIAQHFFLILVSFIALLLAIKHFL